MRAVIICNPVAGAGRAGRCLEALQREWLGWPLTVEVEAKA